MANYGTVTLTSSELLQNRTVDRLANGGGALFNAGTANVDRSTIHDNVSAGGFIGRGGGGGIFNATYSQLNVLSSTISGNEANVGGGIASAGTVDLTFSTVAANRATSGQGDQLFNYDSQTLVSFDQQFGANGRPGGEFKFPGRLATDASGRVYITDTGNNRVQVFDATGMFLFSIGKFGTGDGEFDFPHSVAVGPDGRIYVTDFHNYRVQIFDSNGQFLSKFGSQGSGSTQFSNQPTGIAVGSNGTIYVASAFYLQGFNADFSAAFPMAGGAGNGPGQLILASGISVDASNQVYVADTNNNRVQVFSSSGQFLNQFGTQGSGNNQFQSPSQVSVDSAGRIYVSDGGNDIVKVFDSNRSFLFNAGVLPRGSGDGSFLGVSGVAVGAGGRIYAGDFLNQRVQIFSTSNGSFQAKFGQPNGTESPRVVAIDPSTGNLVVAAQSFHRIEVYQPDGTRLLQFGSVGTGQSQFQSPRGVAVDPQGQIFVADTGNSRIQVFSSNGTFISTFGQAGTGNGQFNSPRGVTVNNGKLYVADSLNGRVQVFSLTGQFIESLTGFGRPVDVEGGPVGTSGEFLLVADETQNRITVLQNGVVQQTFGSAFGLVTPSSVELTDSGLIYLTDSAHRVLMLNAPDLSQPPVLYTTFGSSGTTTGRFTTPTSVAVTNAGSIYVVDRGNDRVQKFVDRSFNSIFRVRSSLIASPTTGSVADVAGNFISQGNNLIQAIVVNSLNGGLDRGANGFLESVGDMLAVNPRLSPLSLNGTRSTLPTHALLPGSPAIDRGATSSIPLTDQRGVPRASDGDANGTGRSDIGAFERYEADLSGRVYLDRNGDGLPESSEEGAGGWTVFLDRDRNGSLDLGEESTTTQTDNPATSDTDEAGLFQFSFVEPGTFDLRILAQSGFDGTAPAQIALGNSITFQSLVDELTPASLGRDLRQHSLGRDSLTVLDRTLTNLLLRDSSGNTVRLFETSTLLPGISVANGAVAEAVHQGGLTAFHYVTNRPEGGIYAIDSNGAITVIANQTTPVPNGSGNFVGNKFGGFAISDGLVAFLAAGSTQKGLYISSLAGTMAVLADTDTQMPGGGGPFSEFASMDFDQGNFALQAGRRLAGDGAVQDYDPYGIYFGRGTQSLVPVIDRSQTLPGFTVKFHFAVGVALSGESIAFKGIGGSSQGFDFSKQGIYFWTNAAGLVPVALTGSSVPGGGGATWASFRNGVSVDGDQVLFVGLDSAGGKAVYLRDATGVRRILGVNDQLDGNTVRNVSITTKSLLDGEMLIGVQFTLRGDGSDEIYDRLYSATLVPQQSIPVSLAGRGETISDVAFGVHPGAGEIRGTVFADSNNNGVFDSGESSLPGIRVFVDANGNHMGDVGETSVTTGNDGTFRLTGLGGLSLYELIAIPAGEESIGNVAVKSVQLGPREVSLRNNLGFVDANSEGNSSDGRVTGIVFSDSDGDGVQDPGELGLGGRTVFVDENANRVLNGGERSTVTASDGSYVLDQLPATRQAVRVVAPAGLKQTNALGNAFSTATVTLPDSPLEVVAGDFDGDGDDDLVTSIDSINKVRFFKSNGAGAFTAWKEFSVGNGPGSLAVGKFRGSGGLAGVVVGHQLSNSVWVLQPQADSSVPLVIPGGLGNGPYVVTTGDFDGDGDDDIAVASNVGGAVAIFLSNGSGGFTTEQILQLPSTAINPGSLVAANLMGHSDGRLDLAVANVLSNNVTVLVNSGVSGTGRFSLGANLPVGGVSPLSVRAGDLVGDELPELVTTNFGSDDVSVFHNLGGGMFELSQRLGTGTGPGSLQIVDLDRDGNRDILFTNSESANHFGVFRNRGDGRLQAAELYGVASLTRQNLAFSLAVGQFNDDNGDGTVNASDTVDVVVSNRRDPDSTARVGFLSIGMNKIVPGALNVNFASGPRSVSGLDFALQQPTNAAPTLAHAIPDQSATEALPFSFTLATNTFADIDVGDTLTLRATRADGSALPVWLSFDPATKTFSGTPGPADLVTINILVTATDNGLPTPASVSDTFSLAANGLLELIYTATSTSLNATVSGGLVSVTNARLEVRVAGVVIATPVTLAPSAIKSLTINGGTGADIINLTGLSAAMYPRLTRIVLNGNAGKDTITGSNFDETISGGNGTVTTDNDSLNGGGGIDRLVETNITALTVTVSNTQLTGLGTDTLANFEELSLSGGGTVASTFNAASFSGNVTLLGNAGNDVLIGGSRDDSLDGGTGNDKLTGNLGDDVLSGGAGVDTLFGSGGTSYVLSDTALSGVGTDSVVGIEVASLSAPITGTANVTIDAARFTGAGPNTLTGGNGNDRIIGGSGKDSIKGGLGIDRLTGGLGNDTFDGGTGIDVLIESGNVNFTLINTTLTRGTETDSLVGSSVETAQLTGGAGDNRLIATAFTLGAVTLDGGGGNDVLIGGSKNDFLLGGDGRDMVVGGLGIDTLNGNTGEDILIGGTISSTISTATALNLLMAEWTSAHSYAERITKLKNGGGANGTTKLTTTTVATVVNDSGAADQLNGNEDSDWFFKSINDVLDAIIGDGQTIN